MALLSLENFRRVIRRPYHLHGNPENSGQLQNINGTRRSLWNISEIMGSQSKGCSFTAPFGNSSSVMLIHFARYTSSVKTS